MEQAIEAVFENGMFKVIDPSTVHVAEGQKVRLVLEEPPGYTKEEIARRGKDIYERNIQSLIEANNKGRIVAIDVITGEFELADSALTSASQLRARLPEAEVFVLRVGYPALHKTRLRSVSNSK